MPRDPDAYSDMVPRGMPEAAETSVCVTVESRRVRVFEK